MKNRPKQEQKTNLEKLARMSQAEFKSIRKGMATKSDVKRFATRDDLKLFATKADLEGFKDTIIDAVRDENLKILQSNDKVMTKLDRLLTEDAAHTGIHKRVDDTLHEHDGRLKKVEGVAR